MVGKSAPSVPRAGLRNTLRFQLKDPTMDMIEREVFARVVILDKMKLKAEDVYRLQTNRQEKCFDVTVNTGELCKSVMEKSDKLGHTAKECSAPKSCHCCGSSDHLMKDCKDGRKQCWEGVREDKSVKNRLLGEEGQKRILDQQGRKLLRAARTWE
ncbi:hypothetical protein Q8A67_017019 [Cirrhinus molitorella]|uniref:Zinc finger CCHC domain-containing protein n=1 Tax=Cirrhinus molitorella TaxID=172907 RepID=A0AA88PJ34_9TELE|nr:hypothetical protein Q8A67_017019 [Cirrhinus molitorella]